MVDIAEGFSGVPGGARGGIGVEYKKWLGEEAGFWATVWATEKQIGNVKHNIFKIFNSPFLN